MAKTKALVEVEAVEEHVPDWRQHHAVAIGRGAANSRSYEEGDELTVIVDHNRKPASWLKLLDEGIPVDGPNSLTNAVDFAKAAPAKPQSGFASNV